MKNVYSVVLTEFTATKMTTPARKGKSPKKFFIIPTMHCQ